MKAVAPRRRKPSGERPLSFENRAGWHAWLERHHTSDNAAWLLLHKTKAARVPLTLEEAVEEALCFGWIDSVLRPVDDETYCLRFSPRKPGSPWSAINKRRAQRLIRQGRMAAAGLEKIAVAKANGEWKAATDREDVSAIPADLASALRQHRAWAAFQKWPASRKKQCLYWLSSAKRVETRQKRLREIVEMATEA